MSHETGHGHGGGFDYKVTVNGLTMIGWRHGTRAQAEEYAKECERMCTLRASGLGFTKINKEGKVDTSYLRGARKSAEARRK